MQCIRTAAAEHAMAVLWPVRVGLVGFSGGLPPDWCIDLVHACVELAAGKHPPTTTKPTLDSRSPALPGKPRVRRRCGPQVRDSHAPDFFFLWNPDLTTLTGSFSTRNYSP